MLDCRRCRNACTIPCKIPISIAGVAGSNPAEGMDVSSLVFAVCCVGSGLCDELITRSEEFYRVCIFN
jgi:hypothetical protein